MNILKCLKWLDVNETLKDFKFDFCPLELAQTLRSVGLVQDKIMLRFFITI